jgi:protein ImuB
MRRVVSLYLPHWSTDRFRRASDASPSEADLRNLSAPLVTSILDHGRKVVAAIDARARALELRPGMTVTKARALCPDLAVVDADPEADLAGLKRLALWAGRHYSPVVAPDPPDGLWIDITGCAALFGTERALVKDLYRRVAASGVHVHIAVADTAGCAHAVAHHVPSGRPVTIEAGRQRQAMGLLPVSALRLEPGIVEGLRKLGFDRIESLIGQPRAPLARRFGKALHRRLDQALGFAPEPIEPLLPPTLPRARRELMEPIVTPESFARVIDDLATDLAGQLAAMTSGVRRLDLYFARVDSQWQAIRVGSAAPTRDPRHIAKLLTTRIETIDPGLGVEAMTLIATLLEPLGAVQNMLADDGRRGPDIGALVDTLTNRFGAGSLYRSAPRASAMPERTIACVPALGKADGARWNNALPRPGRLLDQPEPVDVTAMLPDHPPAMFVWRRQRYRVVQADGPERLHGEWWRNAGHEAAQPLSVRDYFQVEVEGGGRYWLFRQGDGERASTGPMRWFIHGAFA